MATLNLRSAMQQKEEQALQNEAKQTLNSLNTQGGIIADDLESESDIQESEVSKTTSFRIESASNSVRQKEPEPDLYKEEKIEIREEIEDTSSVSLRTSNNTSVPIHEDEEDIPLSKKEQRKRKKNEKEKAKARKKRDKANAKDRKRRRKKGEKVEEPEKPKKKKGKLFVKKGELQTPEDMLLHLRIKKIVILIVIIILSVALIVFGTYNTFIKQEKTPAQVVSEVNYLNNDTPFPVAGLQGYLAENAEELLALHATFGEGTSRSIKVSNLYITSVVKKNAYICNTYFSCDITTDNGTMATNLMIPMSYNYETQKYAPAGDLSITPVQPADSETKTQDNPWLSFDGLNRVDSKVSDNAAVFLDNFFTLLYNQKGDVSSFYKGTKNLSDYTGTYVKISLLDMYKGENPNGFNTKCTYQLKYNNGLIYENVMYLNISLNGDTWRINNLM